jgi:UDP-N-acetylmuramoyl-L-alanyl-D-glutamate--2,6-diaminopimelate ligase
VKLADLLSQVAVVEIHGKIDVDVVQISADSRTLKPGSLFVAISGSREDGVRFIPEAIKRGASAVVLSTESARQVDLDSVDATVIVVTDVRAAAADLAAKFFGHPSKEMRVAGVTGTNGKTTTTFLIQHICEAEMLRCGLIGTIRYKIGERVLPAARTTPDALETQGLLAQMRDAGCKSVAMEVSSHAIHQKRVRGVEFDTAVFTNLTQDHLDYHKTMDAYFEAKAELLLGLGAQRFKPGKAVVNIDDRYGSQLAGRLEREGVAAITFGQGARADFRASAVRTEFNGSSFQLDALGKSWLVRVPLIGKFNVMNALAALAASHAMGVDLRSAVLAMASAPSVPGRLEPVPARRAFKVFVDYAHTDDALRNVLQTLRALQPRKIITVFGCGGDRDRAKRPLMGAAAAELSDFSIVTSDNPRSENPESIIHEIVSGMRGAAMEVILDRKEAICRAVQIAEDHDIVLIAGKGHETTQVNGSRVEPFSDLAVAQSAIDARPVDLAR